MREGDPRKVAIATSVESRTSIGNEWLAQRLEKGHGRAMSPLIRHGKESPEILKLSKKLEKMLPSADCPIYL